MSSPRGSRTVHELLKKSRKAKAEAPQEPGISPYLLWGGISGGVFLVVLILVFVFWPSSKPHVSDDDLQQQRDTMMKQLQQTKAKK